MATKKQSVPLIDMLQEHQRKKGISFHVPGHKNGAFFHESLYRDFQPVLSYDVTELDHLDDLHAPAGGIKAAQEAAARFYGTEETLFLVGGTTVGNLAMMYALFERGDVVFIQRNSHKSVFHAAQIAGIIPVLIRPEKDPETELPVGITCESFEKAMELYPEAKGLILTYPNYYGVSIDIQPLIQAAKEKGLLVLVDEAHAPHFSIGHPFPPSTLKHGADVVVQSAHKMLPALTMSSFLHLASSLRKEQRGQVKEALTMFQSSSPSYLLMASLDGARAYLEGMNRDELNAIFAGIDEIKKELAKIEQIELIDWNLSGKDYYSDPLKVTMKTKTALTGFELQQLFYEAGLYPEMADDKHVLFVFGLGVQPVPDEEIERLGNLLSPYKVSEQERCAIEIEESYVSKLYISPNEIRQLPKRSVPLMEAINKIAAETIIPYPPGNPIVLSGEKISAETAFKIAQLKKAGARFQGHELERVLVIDVEEKECIRDYL